MPERLLLQRLGGVSVYVRAVMETKGRLIAGSHNRNEFVLINADEIGRVSALLSFPHNLLSLCSLCISEQIDDENVLKIASFFSDLIWVLTPFLLFQFM
ncbi:hypothetical protein RHSIM_Rhsim11G0085600 [Rhododendron simsii]|uniref:Uncharacterized protein n=1 Tax=Rhododendron simsii TaxID=118357 RepID=A0A834GAS3_RHOSS|nr:hypothetical protein RHSIM_Rhsim11G0085600 [Rhododendron simsii]